MATISSEKLQAGGAVSFSPDGRFLISSHVLLKNLATEMWDTTAGTLVHGNSDATLRDRGKPFFSPDGRFREAAFFPMKEFYDPSAGSLLNPFTNGYKDVYKQRIDLYDGPSDKRLRELDGGKAPETGIVPAAGYENKIDIFEVASGKTIRTLPHSGRIVSLSFSPNGRFLVALGENNEKYIWNAESGEKLATLVNFSGAFNSRGGDWL